MCFVIRTPSIFIRNYQNIHITWKCRGAETDISFKWIVILSSNCNSICSVDEVCDEFVWFQLITYLDSFCRKQRCRLMKYHFQMRNIPSKTETRRIQEYRQRNKYFIWNFMLCRIENRECKTRLQLNTTQFSPCAQKTLVCEYRVLLKIQNWNRNGIFTRAWYKSRTKTK